jgi:tellurite resistance protein TehA-like permease
MEGIAEFYKRVIIALFVLIAIELIALGLMIFGYIPYWVTIIVIIVSATCFEIYHWSGSKRQREIIQKHDLKKEVKK